VCGSFFACGGERRMKVEEFRSGGLKYKIAVWGSAGFLVAGFWAVYAFLTAPGMLFAKPEIMVLVRLTCPIALLSQYPISLAWVLLANAATYAMLGLIVENLRQDSKLPTSGAL